MRVSTGYPVALLLALTCWNSRVSAVAREDGQPASDDPVGLVVRVVNGHTGEPVDGVGVEFKARTGFRNGKKLTLAADGDRFVLKSTGFARGERSAHILELKLPPGWVQEEEDDPYSTPPMVTLLTRTVTRTVVVWPEADIQVHVVKSDGTPAAGAILSAVRLGETQWESKSANRRYTLWSEFPDVGEGATAADGVGKMTGVPSIPGARYRIRIWWEDRIAVSDAVTLLRGTESMTLTVRLPEEAGGSIEVCAGMTSGIGCYPGVGELVGGEGRVRVVVQWLNGDPARGVRVSLRGAADIPLARKGFYRRKGWTMLARTGSDGYALFEGVPVGEATARVDEPGFVPGMSASVSASAGVLEVVYVREGVGRDVEVRVLNSLGEGVPGAQILVLGGEEIYAPVDASGVQQLGVVTGAGGLAFLPRVPQRELRAQAVLGKRTMEFRIASDRAEVVLPDK